MKLNPIAPTMASLTETEKEIIVQWNLPHCQDIQVYVDQQTLYLSCAIQHQEETEEAKVTYTCQLRQKLLLPVKVKGVETRTSYQNGVLQVIIDKV